MPNSFSRTCRDYGGGIEKIYQFPAQTFGTDQRLKHVRRVVLATRSDTDGTPPGSSVDRTRCGLTHTTISASE